MGALAVGCYSFLASFDCFAPSCKGYFLLLWRTCFVFIASAFFSSAAFSQSLLISPVAEKTVAGWQHGLSAVVQTESWWMVGGFYQTGFTREWSATDDVFYGVMLYAPVMRERRMTFYFSMRGGFIRKNFLVVSPGVETIMRLRKNIYAGMGSAWRMRHPSVYGKIYFTLVNRSD